MEYIKDKTGKTATKDTVMHYRTPEVMETILRVSKDSDLLRWAVGDSQGWYKYKKNNRKYAQPLDEQTYKVITHYSRTLHNTLSFFNPDIFCKDFGEMSKEEATRESKEHVGAYTFGIDIDTVDPVNGHGANITEPEVKEAIEAMATFFITKLKEHAPNSIYAAFSGGGIYVFVHHGVFKDYFKRIAFSTDYQKFVETLTYAINNLIDKLSTEFDKEYPQYKPYVKADLLNNSKRVFKTIFSIHKKHPYAVIPLDINNIRIDFGKATLPLGDDILEAGKKWYREFDDNNQFLNFLKPYLENTYELLLKKWQMETADSGGVMISKTRHNFSEFPPCVTGILNRAHGGNGATRALAFLAAFLGQAGEPKAESRAIWYKLAERWGASTTNIFDSWYLKMNCPSCNTLRTLGPGYPHIDIVNVKACKPDMRCYSMGCSNPIYYLDKDLYKEKLKRDFFA